MATGLDARYDRLLSFLPAFAARVPPGQWQDAAANDDGSITSPHFAYSDLLTRFVEACYEGGWIRLDFEWRAWLTEAQKYLDDPRLISRSDLPTLERLLTTHIRNDRFTE